MRTNFYTFPYVRFHGRYYPLIPLTLTQGKITVKTFALLDSGASISVFRPELKKALGFFTKKKKVFHLGTATGGVDIDVRPVGITVGETKFKTKIGFPKKNGPVFNILGREGFFHRFSICFNEIAKTVILVPLGTKMG